MLTMADSGQNTPAADLEESVPAAATDSPNVPPLRALLGLWRPILVLILIAGVVMIFNPGELIADLGEFRESLRDHGVVGVLVFLGLYVIAAVAIVPQAVLKVAAGGLYGSVLGVVVASIGSTLGAAACFLLARYVMHGTLAEWLRTNRRFRRLEDLTKHHGAVIVAISRLVPVLPGNLVNYAFGLVKVPFWTFVFWSWLCMLPGTVVLVVGTDAVVQGVEEGEVPWALVGVIGGALALLGISMTVAHRQFQRHKHRRDEPSYADL